jgi:ABC-2 type transport system permease protein
VVFVTLLAWALFGFHLFALGWIVAVYIFNVFIFGWAFGCITSSLIFRFGARVQIFAWSLIAVIYPISGVFYPLSVLPPVLADLARLLPVSYIFEGLRQIIITGQAPELSSLFWILALNLLYLAFGIGMFLLGFRHAKNRGWFIHPT